MSLRWLPNALCVLRMLLTLPVAWLLWHAEYWWTLLVFFVAAVTDAADGWLAKRFHWESELGKALDPLADKLLLVCTFIVLSMVKLVPFWLTVLVVLRDLLITGGAIAYRLLYGPIVGAAPTMISKLNTLMQILYVGLVVCAKAMGWVMPGVLMTLAVVAALTTLASGADYVMTYSRRAVQASRAQRY
jgi:cardiolipin synthase (CMP-forming)